MIEWFGYQAHFCCPCEFHLTTLVSNGEKHIIISTVGRLPNLLQDSRYERYEPVGCGRWFETEVYEAKKEDFWEIDVTKNLESKSYGFKEFPTYKEINQFEKEADMGHKLLVLKYQDLLGA